MKQGQAPEPWFTTMVDLYRLRSDFPGFREGDRRTADQPAGGYPGADERLSTFQHLARTAAGTRIVGTCIHRVDLSRRRSAPLHGSHTHFPDVRRRRTFYCTEALSIKHHGVRDECRHTGF